MSKNSKSAANGTAIGGKERPLFANANQCVVVKMHIN